MHAHPSARPPVGQQVARLVAGAGMAFAGVSHLTFAREGFRGRIPFLVAVFPGNIAQYRNHVDGLGLDTDCKRLVRLCVEPLMWATALHAGGLIPGTTDRRALR